jgi:hypothetical protein
MTIETIRPENGPHVSFKIDCGRLCRGIGNRSRAKAPRGQECQRDNIKPHGPDERWQNDQVGGEAGKGFRRVMNFMTSRSLSQSVFSAKLHDPKFGTVASRGLQNGKSTNKEYQSRSVNAESQLRSLIRLACSTMQAQSTPYLL